MKRSVAIIGSGFSGSLTALNILRHPEAERDISVSLIESRGSFGPGLAYTVPSDRFKLNVRAKAMGAFPDDPAGFLGWLHRKDPTISGEDFISRRLYGEYLQELVRETANRNENSLHLVEGEVSGVRRASQGFIITLADGRTLHADICVLAIGNILRRSLNPSQGQSVLREPYKSSSYDDVSLQSEILILGSSLTAVDVILECEGRGFRGHYTVLSRNGRFPLPHEDPALFTPVQLPSNWADVANTRKLVRFLRVESRKCGSSQPIFDAMRPQIQTMWRNLPVKEKRAFLRHAKPFWEVHRHRIPANHLATIQALQRTGRLDLLAGRIRELSDGQVTLRSRGREGHMQTVPFDAGFMCVGPEGDLAQVSHPLVKSLLEQGLLKRGELGLGVDSSSAEGQRDFIVVGPMERESLWEITAVRELREQASRVAEQIILSTN